MFFLIPWGWAANLSTHLVECEINISWQGVAHVQGISYYSHLVHIKRRLKKTAICIILGTESVEAEGEKTISHCQALIMGEGMLYQQGKVMTSNEDHNEYTADLVALEGKTSPTQSMVPPFLSTISTPVKIPIWEERLASHPDGKFANYVVNG